MQDLGLCPGSCKHLLAALDSPCRKRSRVYLVTPSPGPWYNVSRHLDRPGVANYEKLLPIAVSCMLGLYEQERRCKGDFISFCHDWIVRFELCKFAFLIGCRGSHGQRRKRQQILEKVGNDYLPVRLVPPLVPIILVESELVFFVVEFNANDEIWCHQKENKNPKDRKLRNIIWRRTLLMSKAKHGWLLLTPSFCYKHTKSLNFPRSAPELSVICDIS